MTEPFFARLKKYFASVGKVLRGDAEAASIFPDTYDKGLSRERAYIESLKRHVPSSCNVFLGGFLFDLKGHESKQIDVIITNDLCPRFDFPPAEGKSFACVDGTIAVASIKSKLDSCHLKEALSNLASIPEKEPLADRLPPGLIIEGYWDWPFKIIFATQSASGESVAAALAAFYNEHSSIPPSHRPNLIHVAGQYNIIRANREFHSTRAGTELPEHSFHFQSDKSDAFALFYALSQIQQIGLASRYLNYRYTGILNQF